MNVSRGHWRWFLSAMFYRYSYIRIAHQVDEDLFVFLGDRVRGAVVADCGCGPGIVVEKFVRRGAAKVLAVDVNAAMLNQARRRLAAYLANGQVETLHMSFAPESFAEILAHACGQAGLDIVLFKRSLYVRPEQAKRILAMVCRYLRPNGVLAVIHPERAWQHYAFGPGLKVESYTPYHLFNRGVSRLADWCGIGQYTVYDRAELQSLVQAALPTFQVISIPSRQVAYNLVAATMARADI